MNIFQDFTLTWWQAGIFKWGMFLLGIAVGAYWPAFFGTYIPFLLVAAAVLLACITTVWLKQIAR